MPFGLRVRTENFSFSCKQGLNLNNDTRPLHLFCISGRSFDHRVVNLRAKNQFSCLLSFLRYTNILVFSIFAEIGKDVFLGSFS